MIQIDGQEERKGKLYPEDPNCVQYYAPGHLAREGYQNSLKLAATYIAFNSTGSEMLVNLGGEQVYLFDVNNSRHTNIMHVPQDVVRRKRNEFTTSCCDVSGFLKILIRFNYATVQFFV